MFALLKHFGLLSNNLVFPGYTLEQTAGEAINERFEMEYLKGLACENVLAALARLCGKRFDLVLLDGNHDEQYLEREFVAVRALLADHGIVVFDDVSTHWEGVAKVFGRAVQGAGCAELRHSKRVGIVQVGAASDEVVATHR